jgi:hypothetical protein
MGLDVWFREDVARILSSIQEAMGTTIEATSPASPEEADAYHRGVVDALRAVGIAFGVAIPRMPGQGRVLQSMRIIDAELSTF